MSYVSAKCERNLRGALALRELCDELWRDEYRRAAARIERHRDAVWCKVKVPFACDDEMESWYEWVLTVASYYGFERRPGGNSGLGYDLVYFERPTIPDQGLSWSSDELNGDPDGI